MSEGSGKRYINASYYENLARTEKARRTAAVSKTKRQCEAKIASSASTARAGNILSTRGIADPESYRCRLQSSFFTNRLGSVSQHESYVDNQKALERDRCRAVYSLIKTFVRALVGAFGGNQNHHARHVLNTQIIDDTSTRLRGPSSSDQTTIFTVMNSVSAVYLRCEDFVDLSSSSAKCMHIPSPTMLLESGHAKSISSTAMACSLITSHGVGSLLQRWGVPQDLFQSTSGFRTLVFVGDSLKANGKAYSLEQERLHAKRCVDSSYKKNLSLKIKCSMHQVSLIRKPICLFIPRFWSTLVRLSHLYETLSFRKQMATTLTAVLASSFVHIQTVDLPVEMSMWAQRAERLKSMFLAKSVRRKKLLSDCLAFCNGDISGFPIVHYCSFDVSGQPCCKTYEEALNKAMRLVVGFFAAGFPVPLLYRFKHYDEAAGFLQAGLEFHQILRRALALFDTSAATATSENHASVIDSLLGDLESPLNDSDFQDVINDLIAAEQSESWQSTNIKRKEMVKKELAREDFTESAYMINLIIKPMDYIINRLFKRSKQISELTHLRGHHPDSQEYMLSNKSFFLEMMSGKVGWNLIEAYAKLLDSELYTANQLGISLSASSQKTVFIMTLICISDGWRRFVYEHSSYPHQFFELAECDLEKFCTLWDFHQTKHATCPQCCDSEFSSILLAAYPSNLQTCSRDVQVEVHTTVVNLLHDVCVYAPLSSDAVEIKNGSVQLIASRRGNTAVKAPRAAREISLLQSAVRRHGLSQHFVEEQTLPAKRSIAGIVQKTGLRRVAWSLRAEWYAYVR